MTDILVLTEPGDGGPGRASVALSRDGQGELAFELEGDEAVHRFPCSMLTLLNVGLGMRAHLASEDGACAVAHEHGRIVFNVKPMRAPTKTYAVTTVSFADKMSELMRSKIGFDLIGA